MNKFQEYLLRWILRAVFVQGYQFHRTRAFFRIVVDEFQKVFYEDNLPTIQSFLNGALGDVVHTRLEAIRKEIKCRACRSQ